MTDLVKLWDEKALLVKLKQDTLFLIQNATSMEPIKKLVQCYDILDLTLAIQHHFPTVWPELPECDPDALLQLRILTREIFIYHRADVPPEFDLYTFKVKQLLRIFQVPKEEYENK